jgi:hypothetical protein
MGFARRLDGQLQGVHLTRQFLGQNGVDAPLASEPGLTGKGFRDNLQAEMGLAAGVQVAMEMTLMEMGIVMDHQPARGEGGGELAANALRDGHDRGKLANGAKAVKTCLTRIGDACQVPAMIPY